MHASDSPATASPSANTAHDTPRLLVFDSGVGGLSVMREITRENPFVDIVYASDNAAFPYGTKAPEVLLPRIGAVMQVLIARYQPQLVVIACNTASTLALSYLRERFSVPFVGVVPAIKPAAAQSHTKVIGLLATPATIRRDYTQELIKLHAADCEIIKVGSSWLVQLAEQKLRGEPVDSEALTAILTPFIIASDCDQLVLACTHFPLLREEIQALLPCITLVDSGAAIARRVHCLLNERAPVHEPAAMTPRAVAHRAAFTRAADNLGALSATLADYGLAHLDIVAVD